MAPDDIDYDGNRIDTQSQIIIQILRDLGGEATAGKLRSEAGLDDTSSVHHRVREHLGPSAAGLIARIGRAERPGGQSDEVIYGLTDEGLDFAVANDTELTDAVAAAEAVDTLRRIRATVDGFEARVTDVEGSVENMDAWKNRWSTRVGRVEKNIGELEDSMDDLPNSEAVTFLNNQRVKAAGEYDTVRKRLDAIDGRLNDLDAHVDGIEQRLDEIESGLDDYTTKDDLAEEIELAEFRIKSDMRREKEQSGGFFSR